MSQPRSEADDLRPDPGAQSDMWARRRLLKRSLGVAAPVVMSLTSPPVSAGVCITASGFISAATFASRRPASVMDQALCNGLSPTGWLAAEQWPAGIEKASATFSTELNDPAYSDHGRKLTDVLASPGTLEAHVAAVYLSASSGMLTAPFTDGAAVRDIWARIRSMGYYVPDDPTLPALTGPGTLQWLAKTWDSSI